MASNPYGVVYLITNLVNGKYYVGKTTNTLTSRWVAHKSQSRNGSKSYLATAIRKHGELNFVIERVAEASDRELLSTLETAWVLATGSYISHIGYNLTLGGDGFAPNEDSRAKHGESLRRYFRETPGARERLSKARTGIQHTPEAKAKISLAGIGRPKSEATRRKLSDAFKGKPLAPTTVEKLSAERRTRFLSEESRAKQSERLLAFHATEEGELYRQRSSAARKGLKPSAASRAKCSEALKGKPWSEARRQSYLASKRQTS